VAFRKHPTYVRKTRSNSYQLQRGVPRDLQAVIGKTVWTEPGGATYREAHRLAPAFVARTDLEIKIARGEINLSKDEQIDAIPKNFDLGDKDLTAALLTGLEQEEEEGTLSAGQVTRARRIVAGNEKPREHITADELIALATTLKSPAERTRHGWQLALRDFLKFAEVTYPSAATRQHAVDYRTYLLERLAASTAKTQLAYLGGLWSVLCETNPDTKHLFQGLNKRIKVERKRKEEVEIPDPSTWQGNQDHRDILSILYFTGARLGEIAGLRACDIREDRIVIVSHELRPLKTHASEREIPLHSGLCDLASRLRNEEGLLWPNQRQSQAPYRWGVNLSKPCKAIVGVSPKGLRDRVATVLRTNDCNEALVVRLLGHEPGWISAQYGAVPWKRLVEAVELL
jgi:integrase